MVRKERASRHSKIHCFRKSLWVRRVINFPLVCALFQGEGLNDTERFYGECGKFRPLRVVGVGGGRKCNALRIGVGDKEVICYREGLIGFRSLCRSKVHNKGVGFIRADVCRK